MVHDKYNRLPASSVVDASLSEGRKLMIEMATNYEPTPIFFMVLLLGMGVLLFTVYAIIMWGINRKNSKQLTDRRNSKPTVEGKIKWQRRIEAIKEVERE